MQRFCPGGTFEATERGPFRFPAAVLVSIGCCVALKEAPRAMIDRAMLQVADTSRQAIDAGHVSTSPGRRKSRMVCSASRPHHVVPLCFSARMVWQPAAQCRFDAQLEA
jgi:hypothetical protein